MQFMLLLTMKLVLLYSSVGTINGVLSNDTFLHRVLPLNPPLVLYEIPKKIGKNPEKIREKSGKIPGFQKCSKWPNSARNGIKKFRGYFINILFFVTSDEKQCH